MQTIKGEAGENISLTNIERTLIDITVRPSYGGGESTILRCYLSAKGRVSPPKLIKTLKELNYIYPYHQAIGFYMESAGYAKESWENLREDFRYDFFLAHEMKNAVYNEAWRIYIPKGFNRSPS